MPDATRCAAARPCSAVYCDRCDLLVGLDGLRVAGVERRGDGVLVIDAESPPGPVGCPECGVVAESAGRKVLVLTDAPMGGTPVRVRWRKRRWRCRQDGCGVRSFTEQNPAVAAANKALTARAVAWAVAQMRRENASVRGVARQLRVAWRTVWTHVEAELQRREQDPGRFDGVEVLGVDEHLWHHVSTKPVADGGRGPKELTGMVDLTRDATGRVRARLLDLVPGRSSKAYADWIKERDEQFRAGVKIAALDPFAGYKKALDDELVELLPEQLRVATGARALADRHVLDPATRAQTRPQPLGLGGRPRPGERSGGSLPGIPDREVFGLIGDRGRLCRGSALLAGRAFSRRVRLHRVTRYGVSHVRSPTPASPRTCAPPGRSARRRAPRR